MASGEYMTLHKAAVPCRAGEFAELWRTSESPSGPSGSLLQRVKVDSCKRLTAAQDSVKISVYCSPDGELPVVAKPATYNPVLSYTFNQSGSTSRRLHVMSEHEGDTLWTAAVDTGDLLEYQRAAPALGGTFRLIAATDRARCNGKRIVITVELLNK